MTTNAELKAQILNILPAGWRCRVRVSDRAAQVVIEAAPSDLLAMNAAMLGRDPAKPYASVVPSAYEQATDGDALVIRRLLAVMHAANTVQFNAEGDRVGPWRAVEVWIGHWRQPFERLQAVTH